MSKLAAAEALVRALEGRLRHAKGAVGQAKGAAAAAVLADAEGDRAGFAGEPSAAERLERATLAAARLAAEAEAIQGALALARERLEHARARSPTTASDDLHRRVQEQADRDNRALDEAALRLALISPDDVQAMQAATTLGVEPLTAEQRERERRRQGWTYPPLHVTGGIVQWRRCPPEAVPEPADEVLELPAGPEGDAIARELAGLELVGTTETGGGIWQRRRPEGEAA